MKLVMNVSDDIVVLDFGRWLAEGEPAAICADPSDRGLPGHECTAEEVHDAEAAPTIHAGYGRVEVLKGINLEVDEGRSSVWLAPMVQVNRPSSRRSRASSPRAREQSLSWGRSITGERPDEIVRAGISHVPEGRQIFASLTVQQNLILGAMCTGA